MPLIYSFVARDTVILAEYTSYSGNFNTVAIECLQNIKHMDQKFTIVADKHTFNFLVSDGYTFLVVADEAYGRQIPFAYLERVRDEFKTSYGEKGKTATAHSLDRSFGPKLKAAMEYCMEHPEEVSKIASVQQKVNQVKDVMVQNINQVMVRGEKLEVLVDKTDDLRSQAEKFQKQGRQLRSKMWWQNCRMKLIIAVCILLLGVILFVIICFSGGNCLK